MTKSYPFVRTGSDLLRRGSNDVGILNKISSFFTTLRYLPFA